MPKLSNDAATKVEFEPRSIFKIGLVISSLSPRLQVHLFHHFGFSAEDLVWAMASSSFVLAKSLFNLLTSS